MTFKGPFQLQPFYDWTCSSISLKSKTIMTRNSTNYHWCMEGTRSFGKSVFDGATSILITTKETGKSPIGTKY